MQRVTPRPSIPSSGRGRPARGLAGLGAIAGPRALPPGSPRSPSFPAPAPPRYKARSTVRTMVAEAGFVRGGQCGTRGGPPLRHGGPRRESFGLRGRVVPHGCSRDHQRVKSDRTPSDYYRYAGMAELADATDLKFRAAIRWNTMFPPALKGWNDPAPPVPRPRACPPPHPSRSRRAPTAPLKLTSLKPYTSASLQYTGRAGVAEWQTQRT